MSSLLKKTCQNGSRTIIVTNAQKTWVDYSSQTLMPKTANLLKSQIEVFSARDDSFALPPSRWKIKKFLELHDLLGLNPQIVTNLMVIGDSMNEMHAG